MLLIDADGIVHGGSFFALGRIPWSKIKSTRISNGDSFGLFKQKNLVIEIVDDASFLKQSPAWKRALVQGSVILADYELASPIDTVQLTLENHLHARRNQNRIYVSTSEERALEPLKAGR